MILAYKSISVCCHSPCCRPFEMNLTVSVKFEFDSWHVWWAPFSLCSYREFFLSLNICLVHFNIVYDQKIISNMLKMSCALSLFVYVCLCDACLFSSLAQENWLGSAFELQICHNFMWQMKQLHHNKYSKKNNIFIIKKNLSLLRNDSKALKN